MTYFDNKSELYRRMYLIRRTEELVLKAFKDKKLVGTAHPCIGQEAVSVGMCSLLNVGDVVFSNHRGHGHMLALGLEPEKLIYEIAGRDDGQCSGLGGSQHIAAPEIGFMGSNGITGGSVPIATGFALGYKRAGLKNKVVVFFGDGASSQGVVHESMNMASIWKLPIIFVCENNGYAMSSPSSKFVSGDFMARAAGYGMSSYKANGSDVMDVMNTAHLAYSNNTGPVLIECLTYRFCGHSKSDQQKYRTVEEVKWWKGRDPIKAFEKKLDEQEVISIRSEIDKRMSDIEASL